jgi:hypothetical protein
MERVYPAADASRATGLHGRHVEGDDPALVAYRQLRERFCRQSVSSLLWTSSAQLTTTAFSSAACPIVAVVTWVGVLKMSLAMEQIVGAYLRLRNREALAELRTHRQTLLADLNNARPNLNFDTSLALPTWLAILPR